MRMGMAMLVRMFFRFLPDRACPERAEGNVRPTRFHDDINFCCGNAAAIHTGNVKFRPNSKSCDGLLEYFGRNSHIDQRAQEHVTTYAGKAVEVGDAQSVGDHWLSAVQV